MNIDPASGRPIVEISHSGLASFTACPRRFAYRKILITGNEARSSSTAADVGTAIHEGLQHYAIHKDKDAALLAMLQHHPIELYDNKKAAQYSVEACVTTMLQAMEHEVFSYDLVYVTTPEGVEKPGVEAKFLVEIDLGPDCPLVFHLRGYIDLIMRSPLSGNFLPIDIKTTTPQALATMEGKFAYDYQLTSYGVPLNALLGQFENFETGIFAVILSDNEPKSQLFPYHKTNTDVEDYQLYLLEKCSQIARNYTNQYFPRHPGACVSYGKLCNYHSHCHLRSLKEMQMRINPSMKPGTADTGRAEEEPWIKIKVEGTMI